MKIKVNGIWKQVTELYIKVSGTYQKVTELSYKESGIYRDVNVPITDNSVYTRLSIS